MEQIANREHMSRKRVRKLSTVLLTGSLTLAGCGGSSNTVERSPGTPQPVLPSELHPTTFPTTASSEGAHLVFDDLHGGSSIIQVYPGVTTSAADKQFNGTFKDGDTVPAECKTEGRTVHSDPSVGEEDRTSSEWIRLYGTPGKTQYATAVYVEDPTTLLKQLPNC